MEIIAPLFEVLTPWHWLGLALILLGLEMMFGTYDLLWLAGAAFLTAAYAVIAPDGINGWQSHLVVFSIAGVALIVLGRTAFANLRKPNSDRPTLNMRNESLVGKTAVAVGDFAGGEGRVKVGDSTWMAHARHGSVIADGMEVTIEDVDGTMLIVTA
ncbi:NfeD family protein [Ponticaulis sp.]|uniref:NfeD family protein n=1 Tax=Ponticaulis sp. TaxID=2020902 RepID=UPI0025F4D735|nr:NfeD family protein [Ponticaulis sp.]|tara:strand:- start:113762 stop:114232 length:471 start_codon:yes stop_codon:yes gene_type:complete